MKNESFVMLCKIENVVFWRYDQDIEETNGDNSNKSNESY